MSLQDGECSFDGCSAFVSFDSGFSLGHGCVSFSFGLSGRGFSFSNFLHCLLNLSYSLSNGFFVSLTGALALDGSFLKSTFDLCGFHLGGGLAFGSLSLAFSLSLRFSSISFRFGHGLLGSTLSLLDCLVLAMLLLVTTLLSFVGCGLSFTSSLSLCSVDLPLGFSCGSPGLTLSFPDLLFSVFLGLFGRYLFLEVLSLASVLTFQCLLLSISFSFSSDSLSLSCSFISSTFGLADLSFSGSLGFPSRFLRRLSSFLSGSLILSSVSTLSLGCSMSASFDHLGFRLGVGGSGLCFRLCGDGGGLGLGFDG